MPLRLSTRKPIGEAIARAMGREFDIAIAALEVPTDAGAAVLEARKRLKKIRALRRLVREFPAQEDAADRQLRNILRRLSSARDADARLDALRDLGHQFPTIITDEIAARVIVALGPERQRVDVRVPELVKRSLRQIQKLREPLLADARRMRQAHHATSQLLDDYLKAREATTLLTRESHALDFHAWRQRVKRHAYHLQLFEGTRARLKRTAQLKRLEEWLGQEHDLVVLRSALLGQRREAADLRATALVLGAAILLQTSLRRRAVALGRKLFAEPPPRFHGLEG